MGGKEGKLEMSRESAGVSFMELMIKQIQKVRQLKRMKRFSSELKTNTMHRRVHKRINQQLREKAIEGLTKLLKSLHNKCNINLNYR